MIEDWLVCLLVDWLDCWLFGGTVGWLVGGFVGWSVGWLVALLIDWLISWFVCSGQCKWVFKSGVGSKPSLLQCFTSMKYSVWMSYTGVPNHLTRKCRQPNHRPGDKAVCTVSQPLLCFLLFAGWFVIGTPDGFRSNVSISQARTY